MSNDADLSLSTEPGGYRPSGGRRPQGGASKLIPAVASLPTPLW